MKIYSLWTNKLFIVYLSIVSSIICVGYIIYCLAVFNLQLHSSPIVLNANSSRKRRFFASGVH